MVSRGLGVGQLVGRHRAVSPGGDLRAVGTASLHSTAILIITQTNYEGNTLARNMPPSAAHFVYQYWVPGDPTKGKFDGTSRLI